MSIVDIVGGKCGQFTVNTAVNEVAIVGTPAIMKTDDNAAAKFFEIQPNDNLNIIGAWIVLPYCFGSGTQPQALIINGKETVSGTTFQIPGIGSGGVYHIPVENVETPTDIFVPFTSSPNDAEWYLFCSMSINGRISMLNVPAALNTEVIDVWCYLRIQHNLALTL